MLLVFYLVDYSECKGTSKLDTFINFYNINIFKNREVKEEPLSAEEVNGIYKELYGAKEYFVNFIKKTISCEDKLYTSRVLIETYLLMKITYFLSDKFIILLILNVIIMYAPLEKNFPHFLFKCRMTFRQVIEGIIGLIECIIPKYEEKPNK